jgi:hypothetical protein
LTTYWRDAGENFNEATAKKFDNLMEIRMEIKSVNLMEGCGENLKT